VDEVELDQLALAHALHAAEAELAQGVTSSTEATASAHGTARSEAASGA
jgi:hypothetical protein